MRRVAFRFALVAAPLVAAFFAAPAPVASSPRGALTLPEDFPTFNVTVLDNPAPGLLFLTKSPPGNYLLILDNTGQPQFFAERPHDPQDFQKQPNGLLTFLDRSEEPHAWRALDDTYTEVDAWIGDDTLSRLDGHDFQIMPNGHALILYRDAQIVDMSGIVPGGDPAAWVVGATVRELDAAKNVVFEWRSWDHFQVTDATHIDLTLPVIDYVHCNTVEPDFDGNILLSCRNMDEVTKIDRQTGEILWRMGGMNNEFTLAGDDQFFTRQHSVRRTATGTVTIFDNGTYNWPQESRVVEYVLDEVNKTATLVWEFRNDPPIFCLSAGNSQRLPNGNTLISWGPSGIVNEVRPDGTKAFEMDFTDPAARTYRAFRFPWVGVAAAPHLWAQVTSSSVTLHFTKFGDPDVVQFHVYRGSSPEPTTLVGSTPASSFVLDEVIPGETLHVRVTAEDAEMNESPYSNELEIEIPAPVMAPVAGLFPSDVTLHQSHPNPFRPATNIRFVLPQKGLADLSIYGVGGNLVRTLAHGVMEDGLNEVRWDGKDFRGRNVGAGIYFYRLKVGDRSMTRKMTLLR